MCNSPLPRLSSGTLPKLSDSIGSFKMSGTVNVKHAVGVAFVIWVAYLVGLVIHRLYFHPLAKFPGPKYAAISRWHEYYHEVVRKGQFTFVVQDYHKKYGGSLEKHAPFSCIHI